MTPEDDHALELLVTIGTLAVAGSPPEDVVEVAADQIATVDWPALCVVAGKTRMLPMVGFLWSEGRVTAPRWFREVATASFEYWDRRNRVATAAAHEVVDRFDAGGVRAVARKGVLLASLYPQVGCRPFTDVDLIVPRDDLPAAREALIGLGFHEPTISRRARVFLRVATSGALVVRKDVERIPVIVDVATTYLVPAMLAGLSSNAPAPDFESTARQRVHGLPVMDPADALVDLCVNQYVNATTLYYLHRLKFQRLVPFLDLARLSAMVDREEWRRVIARAEDLGAVAALQFAFLSLRAIAPLSVPDDPALAEVLAAADPGLIDRYGLWDLPQPRSWEVGLRERFVLNALPTDTPPLEVQVP